MAAKEARATFTTRSPTTILDLQGRDTHCPDTLKALRPHSLQPSAFESALGPPNQHAATKLWEPTTTYLPTATPSSTSACVYSSTAEVTAAAVTAVAQFWLWQSISATSCSRRKRIWSIWQFHDRSYSADGIPGWTDSFEAWIGIR